MDIRTNFAVRVATPEDFAAVDSMLRASYPELMAVAYDELALAAALPLMARANSALLASGTYYVAEAHGAVVGCGGWTLNAPGTRDTQPGIAHLRHFGTHRDWIRRGVGRAIYLQCEIAARAAGVRAFVCHSSLNGEPFYAALGFVRVNTLQMTMGPGVALTAVLMRKDI